MNPFFSIIIPVYNVEQYLRECVESILMQSCDDYEIILVDDGSPDKSGEICDKYSEKNNKIKVVHKENGGLSSARNAGIKIAIGKYIIFIDSDDFYDDKDLLFNSKNILTKNDADMLMFGYKELYKNGNTKTVILPTMRSDSAYSFFEIEMSGNYTSSACSKIVKRSIINEYSFLFEVGVTSEDLLWSALLAKYCDTYTVYDSAPYIYRQRQGSITQSISLKSFNQLYEHIKELTKIEVADDKYEAYMNYVSYQYITLLYHLTKFCDNIPFDMYNNIKELASVLKYHSNKKVKIIYYVNKILGFDGLIWLLKVYIFTCRYKRNKR